MPNADERAREAGDLVSGKVGDPIDETTFVTPIARGVLRDGIHDQIERSIAKGARRLLGSHKLEGPGYFYQPSVLADVGPGMAAFYEGWKSVPWVIVRAIDSSWCEVETGNADVLDRVRRSFADV